MFNLAAKNSFNFKSLLTKGFEPESALNLCVFKIVNFFKYY